MDVSHEDAGGCAGAVERVTEKLVQVPVTRTVEVPVEHTVERVMARGRPTLPPLPRLRPSETG